MVRQCIQPCYGGQILKGRNKFVDWSSRKVLQRGGGGLNTHQRVPKVSPYDGESLSKIFFGKKWIFGSFLANKGLFWPLIRVYRPANEILFENFFELRAQSHCEQRGIFFRYRCVFMKKL